MLQIPRVRKALQSLQLLCDLATPTARSSCCTKQTLDLVKCLAAFARNVQEVAPLAMIRVKFTK